MPGSAVEQKPANVNADATDEFTMTTAAVDQEKTGLGNYFIANYPPFSFWKPSFLPSRKPLTSRQTTWQRFDA